MTGRLNADEVARLLAEDGTDCDVTTAALGLEGAVGVLRFAPRGAITLAGVEAAVDVLTACGARACALRPSGAAVGRGETILEAAGSAPALHRGWKVAVTLVEIFSGVATATRAMVDAAAAGDPRVRVAATRKTVPGARRLSQFAVMAGGGLIHRRDLSNPVLAFAQHRVFRPESARALLMRLRQAAPRKTIGVEADTCAFAVAALEAGFDLVQLDKMPFSEVNAIARIKARCAPHAVLAAAGGLTADNATDYARAGADVLVTSWPYTARPADIAATMSVDDGAGARAPA